MIVHSCRTGEGVGLVVVRLLPTEHLPCARTGAVRTVHTWDDLVAVGADGATRTRFAADVEVAHLWDPTDGAGVRFWRCVGGPPTTRADVPGGYIWADAAPGYDAVALHRIIAQRVAALPWPSEDPD